MAEDWSPIKRAGAASSPTKRRATYSFRQPEETEACSSQKKQATGSSQPSAPRLQRALTGGVTHGFRLKSPSSQKKTRMMPLLPPTDPGTPITKFTPLHKEDEGPKSTPRREKKIVVHEKDLLHFGRDLSRLRECDLCQCDERAESPAPHLTPRELYDQLCRLPAEIRDPWKGLEHPEKIRQPAQSDALINQVWVEKLDPDDEERNMSPASPARRSHTRKKAAPLPQAALARRSSIPPQSGAPSRLGGSLRESPRMHLGAHAESAVQATLRTPALNLDAGISNAEIGDLAHLTRPHSARYSAPGRSSAFSKRTNPSYKFASLGSESTQRT